MDRRPRFGLWFGPGLESALAARAALGLLQASNLEADWVLLGPKASLFLFEMDERVPAYIPLLSLEPRRPAQTRLSHFLETRAQFRQLRSLGLASCTGVVVSDDGADTVANTAQFGRFKKALGCNGELLLQSLSQFLQNDRPLLHAGPQALAFATRLYRNASPSLQKWLVIFNNPADTGAGLDSQWAEAQVHMQQGQAADSVVAVLNSGDQRLLGRWLKTHHPDWLQIDPPQAMGLLAYADRVISFSGNITRICVEMGKADSLLLVKTHS